MVFPSGDAYADGPNRASDEWQPEDLPPVPGDEWMRTEPTEAPRGAAAVPPPPPPQEPVRQAPRPVRLAFAPLHKRAFGTAVGVALALVVGAVTLFHLFLDATPGQPNLWLLGQYFYGYRVSWTGLLIGTGWGFVVGFVGGWFFAFCRNLALAISIFITRTRAELAQTRDFLDHI
jgi:hypothetical protein